MKTYKLNNVEVSESDIREIIRNNPELLKEESRGKYFEPKNGDRAYYFDCGGTILDSKYWDDNDTDKVIISMGVYRTKEEAELARDKRLALVRIWKWADKNAYFRPDWKSRNNKYTVYYHNDRKCFDWTWNIDMICGNILPYFKSALDCEKFISENKGDLEIIFLK